MRLARLVIVALAGLMSVVIVSAQSDCLALFRSALISTSLECEDLAAERVCYGNLGISAELTDGAGTQAFSFPGNELSVGDIQTLTSESLDVETGDYGMALASFEVLNSEADNVMVVFGGATLINNSAGVVTIPLTVTFSDGAFSREAPDSGAQLVIPLTVGENVLAVGRNDDASWLQVIVPDGRVAWMLSSLVAPVNPPADFMRLAVADDGDMPLTYAPPMRDLTLTTADLSTPCAGVPDSGVLIQARSDSPLRLRVNGFWLEVMQTAYIRAESTDTISVYAIDAMVMITDADQSTVTINAGEVFDTGEESIIAETDYLVVEHLPYELLPEVVFLPSNWLDNITPETASPLAGLTQSDACVLAVFEDVNVRVGPGTGYQRRGSLLANQSVTPMARAIGTNGRVWLQIGAGAWVANDVVVLGGDCTTVALAEIVPRLR